LPGANQFPSEPDLIRHKTPPDVFDVLRACHQKVVAIATALKVDIATIPVDAALTNKSQSADVHDLAQLITAELAYLHSLKINAPELALTFVNVDDATGNTNGNLDPIVKAFKRHE